jgi:hypothetical protein
MTRYFSRITVSACSSPPTAPGASTVIEAAFAVRFLHNLCAQR